MYTIKIFTVAFFALTLLLKAQDSLYLYSVFHGENDKDQFGVVANVGDVNGDGFEDLMVGAPAYISGAETNGYAKLYFGGASFDTLADMTFRINDPDVISFGYTIAGKGDLNGDGYADFAIAAPYSGSFQVGKVFIYFGGPQLDTIPDLVLTLNPDDKTGFGRYITSFSKLLNDTTVSIIIGDTETYDYDTHGAGKVLIYNNRFITGVANDESRKKNIDYTLSQNYPNPFNPTTTISFSLPSRSFVSLKVFDGLGREVAMLLSEELAAGNYTQQWNASGFSNGVYYYRLQAGTYFQTKKLVLLK